jgi:hypothetical protein
MKPGDLIQIKPCDCCAGRPDNDTFGVVISCEKNLDFNPPLEVIWVHWDDIGLDWVNPKDKHFEIINETS